MIFARGIFLSKPRLICLDSILIILIFLVSCQKESIIESDLLLPINTLYETIENKDTDSTIYISDNILINDKVKARDTLFSYDNYERFIGRLVKSNRFIFVPHNEFETTFSKDKIVISLRHDIDYDINSALRFARREHKLGVRATYFVLHTADYYGVTSVGITTRNPSVYKYLRKIQNEYGHEIGWHNDLVTLQVIYNIDPEKYLKNELKRLKSNGIHISGSAYHGSEYCYKYHYLNSFFWKNYGPSSIFYNYNSVPVNGQNIIIKKYVNSDFGFTYEAGKLNFNHFYADVFFFNNKRWHMNMEDWSSLKPGDRVIILTHSALWD